jgi:hypothetical protein
VIGPKNNKQLADDFVTEFPEISTAGTRTKVRKLISPAKRIIISNVCSSIPHHIIEQALKQTGLKLVSEITTLRAGIAYAHIESFKRQVYVAPQPEETENLPTSIVISYEGTTYRIFTTYDEMVCFLCQKTGNIAAKCHNPTENAIQTKKIYPIPATQKLYLKKKHKPRTPKKTIKENPPNKRKAKNTESTISNLTDPNNIETNTEETTFKEPNIQPKTYTTQEKTPKNKRVKRSQSAEKLHRQPSSTKSLTLTARQHKGRRVSTNQKNNYGRSYNTPIHPRKLH